jgi:hypothetical protein
MGQKWYETNEAYNERIAQEANERTIENLTGSAPTPHWYETNTTYGERIAQEATERIIEHSTGSAPTTHWYESGTAYSERIAQEANECVIKDSTGSAPTTHWYENNIDYDTRIRQEANEQIVKGGTGSSPKQHWLEGEHDYRSRIANEAREVKARERSNSSTASNSGSLSVYDTASDYMPSNSSADYSSVGSATSSLIPVRNSPNSGRGGLVVATIVVFVCGALGVFWYSELQRENQKKAAERARAEDQARQAAAVRVAERTRTEQAFLGKWYYWNRDEGRLAEVKISRQGSMFSAVYRSGGYLQSLKGQLQADNRLMLENISNGKLHNPLTWHGGDFSYEAWLQLGNDGNVLYGSFSHSGPTFVMKRTANQRKPATRLRLQLATDRALCHLIARLKPLGR